jgi:beta-galactosidase/beta-glucuronidase
VASNRDETNTPGRQQLSLDGVWEIIFDPDNIGREANWHQERVFSLRVDRREIRVPSCWEEIEQDYEGVAFYSRRFSVPKHWQGKTVRLHFDAVNFVAEVWLKDQAVGLHEGGFTPFEFRVDKMIRPGQKDTITLRVVGPILLKDKRVDGLGPMETYIACPLNPSVGVGDDPSDDASGHPPRADSGSRTGPKVADAAGVSG